LRWRRGRSRLHSSAENLERVTKDCGSISLSDN
jgi:hypothetical protein